MVCDPIDPQAIAQLLWESKQMPAVLMRMLDMLHHNPHTELDHTIAQSILSHARLLRPLLFNNIIVKQTVSLPCEKLDFVEMSPDFRYIKGECCNELVCWDRCSREAEPCFSARFSGSSCCNTFSPDGDYLVVYSAGNAVIRHTFSTNSDVRLKLSSCERVVSLNKKFMLVSVKKNKSSKIKIIDLEHPDLPIFNGVRPYLEESPDNRFLIVNKRSNQDSSLICVETKVSIPLVYNGNKEKGGNVFSPTGNYLITGICTSTLTVWDLSTNEARAVYALKTDDGTVYDRVSVPVKEYMIIEKNIELNKKQLQVVELKSGNIIYSGISSKDYEVGAAVGYLAMPVNNAIAIYNIQARMLSKTLQFNCPVHISAYSPKGTYMAVKESDDDGKVNIYSVESGNCLMRISDDNRMFCFYNDDDRYLVGWNHKNVSFWNVLTGKHLGTLDLDNLPTMYFKDHCPYMFVGYCAKTKTFSSLCMDDVVKFDATLDGLNNIEKALELAIISNKLSLVSYVHRLEESASGDYGIKNGKPCDPFTTPLLDVLDHLTVCDDCITCIEAAGGYSCAQARETDLDIEPACKRHHSAVDQIDLSRHDWLTINQSQLMAESHTCTLLCEEAKCVADKIRIFDDQLKEFCTLPPEVQQTVSSAMFPSRIFNYYLMFKDTLLELASDKVLTLAPEKSWQYSALKLCLTWLPMLEEQRQRLIFKQKEAMFVYYFNHMSELTETDDPLRLVAQALQKYLVALERCTDDEIVRAKDVFAKQYRVSVGQEVDIKNFINCSLKVSAFLMLTCKAQEDFQELCNKSKGITYNADQEALLQRELEENRASIEVILKVKDNWQGWWREQLDMLKEIFASDKVQAFDDKQRACLQFAKKFKSYIDEFGKNLANAYRITSDIIHFTYADYLDADSKKSVSDLINRRYLKEFVPVLHTMFEQIKKVADMPQAESFLILKDLYISNKLPMLKSLIHIQLGMCRLFKAFNERNSEQLLSILSSQPGLINGPIDMETGDTIMHAITRQVVHKPEYYPLVTLLFSRLKRAGVPNNAGKTPFDIAHESGDVQLTALFKPTSGNISCMQ